MSQKHLLVKMSGNTFLGQSGPIDFRSGPHAGVAPSSSGFGGGALNRGSRPTDVQGGFSIVKADANNPTNVTAAGVVEARNNRGSNIRIPYARLVCSHALKLTKQSTHTHARKCALGLVVLILVSPICTDADAREGSAAGGRRPRAVAQGKADGL